MSESYINVSFLRVDYKEPIIIQVKDNMMFAEMALKYLEIAEINQIKVDPKFIFNTHELTMLSFKSLADLGIINGTKIYVVFGKDEEEKLLKMKKDEDEKNKIYEKQKEFRSKGAFDNYNKENPKVILEDMCIIGTIMKKEILEEKRNNTDKFIPIEEALKEKNDQPIFCLGLLAQNLENLGIITAIEKNQSSNEHSHEALNTALHFITNGLINKNKYIFSFDFGEKRNNELLSNKAEQNKFNNKLRKKLSLVYNIPEDKIILTNPQKGRYEIQIIFETDEFNEIDIINIDKFKAKCKNDNDFKELCYLKHIHKSLIMEGCKLNKNTNKAILIFINIIF